MTRRLAGPLLGLAAIGALVLIVDPRNLGAAISHFNPLAVAPALALVAAFYLLQGLRWHLLLRHAGPRLGAGDSLLLNMAGQAVTAVLPLGDLTRAALFSEVAGAEFGAAAATVTVQELSYTLILVLVAAPGLLAFPFGAPALAATLAGVIGVAAILTVPSIFSAVHRLVARAPVLNRLEGQVAALRHHTVVLLRRPDTSLWSLLDLARALTMITLLWTIVAALRPGAVSWEGAALVLAVSYLGGAISLIPGGAGANEASLVGMLVVLGVDPASAGAAAILQRAMVTGTATLVGVAAYAVCRRRFGIRWTQLAGASAAASATSVRHAT